MKTVKLNLTAKGKEQELILAYLQVNASETLAEKINNGVVIEKDGKRVLSKKTLDGFMQFAEGEAKKLAEKGARSACIEDATVYGWAIHYFEEEEIIGKLYTLDGKELTEPKKTTQTAAPAKPAKKQDAQMSLFGMAAENAPTMSETDDEETDADDEDERELPEEETKIEILQTPQPPKQGIPFYQSYMRFQEQYPDSIIVYRLGDFYEIFGENAQQVSYELDLTLTSRDCGLDERVPMIGFPYHASDMYLQKISEFHNIFIVDDEGTRMIKSRKILDRETGEVTEPESMDDPYPQSTFHKETMILLYELLDGKMNLQ